MAHHCTLQVRCTLGCHQDRLDASQKDLVCLWARRRSNHRAAMLGLSIVRCPSKEVDHLDCHWPWLHLKATLSALERSALVLYSNSASNPDRTEVKDGCGVLMMVHAHVTPIVLSNYRVGSVEACGFDNIGLMDIQRCSKSIFSAARTEKQSTPCLNV